MSEESDDSDVDSEVEAFLYSQIHHEQNEEDPTRTKITSSGSALYPSDVKTSLNNEPLIIDISCYNKASCSPEKQPIKKRKGDTDIITISSSDECEVVLDDELSKYNYTNKIDTYRLSGNYTDIPGLGLNGFNAKKTIKKRLVIQESAKHCGNKNSCISNDGGTARFQPNCCTSDSDVLVLSNSSADEAEKPCKTKKCRQTSRNEDEASKEVNALPPENSDNWFITAGDLRINHNRGSDYRRRKLWKICRNCRRRGHHAKECPEPLKNICCYLCGNEGHHADCCDKLSCFICWQVGHTAIKCPDKHRIPFMKCRNCKVTGHSIEFCPDFWRKYHLTTKVGPVVVGKALLKPKATVFCCNCGKSGHYVHECKGTRMERLMGCNRVDIVNYNGVLPQPQTAPKKQMPKKRHAKQQSFMRPSKKPKLNDFLTNGKLQKWKNKQKAFRGKKSAVEVNIHNQHTSKQCVGGHLGKNGKWKRKRFRKVNGVAGNIQSGQENNFHRRPFSVRRQKCW